MAEYSGPGEMISSQGLKALGISADNPMTRKIAAALSGLTDDAIPKDQLPAEYLKVVGGAATGPSGNFGSYSIILKEAQVTDINPGFNIYSGYFNIKTNRAVASPNIRPTMHEVFGHGRLISLGVTNHHKPVIQFENLQLRVMGLGTYRDGSNHNIKAGETQILTPDERTAIPDYLQKK